MKTLIYALWAIGGLAFFGGIVYAGYCTLWILDAPQPSKMPPYLSWAVTIIGGVLATNFGAVLGISLSPDIDKFGDVAMFKPLQSSNKPESSQETKLEKVQILAAYAYFIGMILAVIMFVLSGLEEDPTKVVSILPELSKTLIGAAVGALAVSTGVKSSIRS